MRSLLAPRSPRALSSSSGARARALAALGCDGASTRETVRDAFYARAKAAHPDGGGGAASAAAFRALAEAYEAATSAPAAAAPVPAAPAADARADPLAVFLRVEKERAAGLRRELARAAALSSGGLDKGGLWLLAAQMASEPAETAAPPRPLPRGRRKTQA